MKIGEEFEVFKFKGKETKNDDIVIKVQKALKVLCFLMLYELNEIIQHNHIVFPGSAAYSTWRHNILMY
jgi:hypothetical protein